MNFTDYGFILLFVPACLIGVTLLRPAGQTLQACLLIAASFVFYGSWQTAAVWLLAASILGNFVLGRALRHRPDRRLLAMGVAANLSTLGYFKYAGFLWASAATVLPLSPIGAAALPLGISFFTFQQISYLVDCNRHEVVPHDLPRYALFISFFPHLIAGPIVLQGDVLRQLGRRGVLSVGARRLGLGTTLFAIGLAKKVIVADSFAPHVAPAFDAAAGGAIPGGLAAWQAAIGYAFQIYFDFSGYSDMAIGLAYMFGVRLPFNFDSPYRATSLIAFWRCWHMSLSRFLRHYLYIPLGGSRRGATRTGLNLMVVMTLGGLWHGAGWTFVLWGALHGALLTANHLWRRLRPGAGPTGPAAALGWLATFLTVVTLWVPFRAASLAACWRLWTAMATLPPGDSPPDPLFWAMAAAALAACLAAPNSQSIVFGAHDGSAPVRPAWRTAWWRPRPAWGLACGTLLALALAWQWHIDNPPEFIYFNF